MTDVPQWSPVDGGNNAASPAGYPDKMLPVGLKPLIRAIMGAARRLQARLDGTATTTGSGSAYALAFDQAPAAYTQGMVVVAKLHAANSGACTLNVGALGAKPIRTYGGADPVAGDLPAGSFIPFVYDATANAGAGAFILPVHFDGVSETTSWQAQSALLTALAGLTPSADQLAYFTGAGTMATAALTAQARALLANATVQAMRATLGLGNAAVLNTGTANGTVALGDHTHAPFVGVSGASGTAGLTPAPTAGDYAAARFLCATGGWAAPTLDSLGDVVLSSPSGGEAIVYDAASLRWVNGRAGATTLRKLLDTSGDGTTTAFTLASTVVGVIEVFVAGAIVTSGFTVAGTTLTFTTAPEGGKPVVAFDGGGTVAPKFAALADVLFPTDPASGDVPVYSVTTGKWGNTPLTTLALAKGQTLAVTGDATAPATALNTGAIALTLASTGVTAGVYGSATAAPVITFDAKGRATGASTATVTPAWGSVTGKPTTIAGYGITDALTLGTTTPVMNGTAAVGAVGKAADAGHVHPTDTTRAAAGANADLTSTTALSSILGNTIFLGTNTVRVNSTASCDRNIIITGGVSGSGTFATIGTNTNLLEFTTGIMIDGAFYPKTDNTLNLGSSTNRFAVLYAGTSTINTSDGTQKTLRDGTGAFTDAEKAVATKLKTMAAVYQLNASIAEKGADKARLHTGFIAQDVAKVFTDAGLDPTRYGLYCADEIEEDYDDTETVEVPKTEPVTVEIITVTDGKAVLTTTTEDRAVYQALPVVDASGTPVLGPDGAPRTTRCPVTETVTRTVKKTRGTGTYRLGLRYDELLCFILAAL